MSIQLQPLAKNSSYGSLEVARLFLNILAFGCGDHNLEFHLPVNWDTEWGAEQWHSVRLGQLLWVFFQGCFQDLMEALSKSTKKRSKWWSAGCPVRDPWKESEGFL